jgi:hypothetical protein
MQIEYDSLRKELLEWQSRRFALLTTSTTVVTGVLALGPGIAEKVPGWSVALLLLLFLSASCRLTIYAGEANQRIGSFLQVFHERSSGLQWEKRSAAFSATGVGMKPMPANLNGILFWFYLVLGFVSATMPYMLFDGAVTGGLGGAIHRAKGLALVIPAVFVFVILLQRLREPNPTREDLVKRWQTVADLEREADPTGSDPSKSLLARSDSDEDAA